MNRLFKRLVRSFGFDLVPYRPVEEDLRFRDLSARQREILETVRPFTMTSDERIISLLHAIDYISRNKIAGDIAECGVWKGGSMMTVALDLAERGDFSRDLWLYDTFEGMSEPTDADTRFDGQAARLELAQTPAGTGIWSQANLESVQRNLFSTGYPRDKIHFVKGKVEETIPHRLPARLALLRLDTDWYASTKHELIHLFPLLERRGILVLDDYGHWQGARKAVDEFFETRGDMPYLHRVDYTGRILVK
jgi:O-methyltransferase